MRMRGRWLVFVKREKMVVINQAFFADKSLDAELIDYYAAANKQEIAQWHQGAQLSTRWGLEFGQNTGGECPGDVRLRKINALLDCILSGMGDEWERSESQILFHDSYILAALPKIFGIRDWERHSSRLLARYGVKEAKSLVLGSRQHPNTHPPDSVERVANARLWCL